MFRIVRTHDRFLTDEEAGQVCRVAILFNFVAISFLGFFALIAYNTGDRQYSFILIGVMTLALGNMGLFFVLGNMQQLVLTTCLGYLFFCLFLLVNGGQNNTGILWHYVYPIMVYYIAGLRLGSLCSALLIFSEVFLLQLDNHAFFQAHYSTEFKLRFLSSMTVMAVMGAMLEHSRSKAQRSLMILANRLQRAAQTDELTGLPNRRALQDLLHDQAMGVLQMDGDLTILLCDIDHFKSINDQHGHAVGDEALRHLAREMGAAIRKTDVLCRWGGEEFVFVLPNTDMICGRIMADRIRTKVENSPLISSSGEVIYMTISCGVANWHENKNPDQLFSLADHRLYQAKSTGRNRIVADG
jgi:diguanylate cyclase (GGDEF)-like protein